MILVDGAGVEKQRCLKRQNDAELKRWALVANPIAHSTAMFRRSLIQKCGGYDESLSGFQDWDVSSSSVNSVSCITSPKSSPATQFGVPAIVVQQRNNTCSALTIVKRHGDTYRGFPLAISMAALYYVYARLPRSFRERSFSYLSRAKKALFSDRRRPRLGTAEVLARGETRQSFPQM